MMKMTFECPSETEAFVNGLNDDATVYNVTVTGTDDGLFVVTWNEGSDDD